MYAPPLRYKREALATSSEALKNTHRLTLDSAPEALSDSLETKAIQHTVDVGYYALAARTTLNLLCLSCSCSEIELVLANP